MTVQSVQSTAVFPASGLRSPATVSVETLDAACQRIAKLEAILRELREDWVGTDAPILQRIDEALR